jgi:hypothetical protein
VKVARCDNHWQKDSHFASRFEHILLREFVPMDEASARLDHPVVRLYNSTYPKRQVFPGWQGFLETTRAGKILAQKMLIEWQGTHLADWKLR